MNWRTSSRKRAVVVAAIAVFFLLVAARLALPYWIREYINDSIAGLSGYEGQVEAVSLSLWQGTYSLSEVELRKVEKGDVRPYLSIAELNVSLQWSALLRGRIAGEATCFRPRLSLREEEDDAGAEEDLHWTQAFEKALPISIDRFEVVDGAIEYARLANDEVGDLGLYELQFVVTNVSNVRQVEDPLPSEFDLVASLFGHVPLEVSGRINLLEELPPMVAQLRCEGIRLSDLNDFAQQFLNLDFKGGRLSLYSEWSVRDAQLEGYLKFIGREIDIVDLRKDEGNPLQFMWEVAAGALVELLSNQDREQFATRVPFGGSLDHVEAGLFAAISTLLRNAFVEALDPGVEDRIDFSTGAVEPPGE